MEKYFKTIDGKFTNIVNHTLEQLEKYPDLRIYIATDSQDYNMTRYATTIVYRYGTRGAHYIVFKQEVPRVPVIYNRLFEEAVRTIDTARILQEELPAVKIEALEFDYNHVAKYKSNPLIQNIGGWATGLGFKAMFKGGEMIASKAADHECRCGKNIFKESELIEEAA